MEFLFRLGARFRNPSLFSRYRFLKESEGWPLDQLKSHQFKECRDFLIFAKRTSRYFREVFAASGFNPEKIESLTDLEALPVTEKKDLIENNQVIHADYPFKKAFQCETSGTTGEVLTFRRNEEWDSANRAAVMRGYSWYGVNPWDRNVYLWGFNFSPRERIRVRFLDLLQNRFRVFSYGAEELEKLARKTARARYLHGYSSMIFHIARLLNERPELPKPQQLRLVKGTSERIFESYQEEAQKAFGRRIVSEYGAAESGLIAFECPQGSMHLHMEGCYVEVVDGEIIVTNFLSRSFPIIRYRLGDSVKMAPEGFRCPCGMAHPVIEEVVGRIGKVVFGKEETYPSLSFYYVFKNLYFGQGVALSYQVKQFEKGSVLIDMEEDVPEHEEAIRREVAKIFDDDLEVTLRFGVDTLSTDGKRQDFVSFVNEG